MAEEVGSSVVGVDHPDGAPFGQGVWISGAAIARKLIG